jgi:uncharacterized membrane protein
MMAWMILGLAIFLGVHSLWMVAPGWRARLVARLGLLRWKGVFSLVSIAGLVVLVWGFGLARYQPVILWVPPAWLRHLNALFTLVAFVCIAAAYVPRNHIKDRVGHPMLAGVKSWAFGHLLANGMLHDEILFGAFLLWSMIGFRIARRRDRAAGVTHPAGTLAGDVVAVVAGIVAWLLFAFWLHQRLIGVDPLA